MFGGSAYLFAIIKYFPFLQRNFFPLRLRHQTSATKLRYLRSSAFYRQPFANAISLRLDKTLIASFKNFVLLVASHILRVN